MAHLDGDLDAIGRRHDERGGEAAQMTCDDDLHVGGCVVGVACALGEVVQAVAVHTCQPSTTAPRAQKLREVEPSEQDPLG